MQDDNHCERFVKITTDTKIGSGSYRRGKSGLTMAIVIQMLCKTKLLLFGLICSNGIFH